LTDSPIPIFRSPRDLELGLRIEKRGEARSLLMKEMKIDLSSNPFIG
jgi:hypothetical protein